jgi:nitrite reductase (NADH) small subunit
MNWIRITAAENIPLREGRAVQVGPLELAIFHTEEGFLAVENRCPHGGGPLADGIVGGTTVTCPLHNWRVCLASGEVQRPCASGAARVATFPTHVVDGVIAVSLDRNCLAA